MKKDDMKNGKDKKPYLENLGFTAWTAAMAACIFNDYFHDLINNKKWGSALLFIIIQWLTFAFWWSLSTVVLGNLSKKYTFINKHPALFLAPAQLLLFAFIYWILFYIVLR